MPHRDDCVILELFPYNPLHNPISLGIDVAGSFIKD